MFEGRAAIGYDHGYDSQRFYLGLSSDPEYVERFVEGRLGRIGEDVCQKMKHYPGTCRRMRAGGRWCFGYCRPSATCCLEDPKIAFLLA